MGVANTVLIQIVHSEIVHKQKVYYHKKMKCQCLQVIKNNHTQYYNYLCPRFYKLFTID